MTEMRVYHQTFNPAEVVRDGFHEDHGYDAPHARFWCGVWLETSPDARELGDAAGVVAIDIPDEVIAEFEQVDLERNLPYREFIVPVEIANRYGPAVPVDPTERPAA